MSDLGNYIREIREDKQLSVRAVATAATTSHTEIIRIENGQRKNPSPPVLRNISQALGVPFEVLMERAGYINNTDFIPFSSEYQNEKEEKFIEILTPKLIKDGWTVAPSPLLNISDLLARNDPVVWNFEFKYFGESTKTDAYEDSLFKTYGKLAVYYSNQTAKFTIVTNNKNAFSIYKKISPTNLKIEVSVMLVDFASNKIVEEINVN